MRSFGGWASVQQAAAAPTVHAGAIRRPSAISLLHQRSQGKHILGVQGEQISPGAWPGPSGAMRHYAATMNARRRTLSDFAPATVGKYYAE